MMIVLVVGPSGSGKDSLLRGAREYFKKAGDLTFVRRYITRSPDDSEDNYYIDPGCFAVLKQVDFFISTWQAHGNHYGIPRHALKPKNGHGLIVVSVSRSAIVDFEEKYEAVTTVEVTVKKDVLKERLKMRGRENDLQIEKRLSRAVQPVVAGKLISFDNSQELSLSITSFIDLLARLARKVEYA